MGIVQALLASTGGASSMGNALAFDGTAQHVNHGLLWQPGTAYTTLYAEAMIKPTGAGYFISAGYGGAHDLLFGVNGDSASGWAITGNVYNSDIVTSTNFTTLERLRDNVWSHVAIAIDGTNLICLINGVPSSFQAFTSSRKTDNGYEGVLFVGGSGHSNFAGRIAGVRIWESSIPVTTANFFRDVPYRPPIDRWDYATAVNPETGLMVPASFVADYRRGSLDDLSLGLSGVKHNGFLAEAVSDQSEGGAFYNNGAYNRDPSLVPQWVNDIFAYPTTAPTGKTQIVGCRIYDDFARPDVHLGTSAVLGLGTTTVGNKTWSGTTHGITNSLAFARQTNGTPTFITDNQVDCTIIIRRPYSTTGLGSATNLYFRGSDANDCEVLNIADSGTTYVLEYVGGVYQGAAGASMDFGTSWLEAKIILAGNQCTIYKDGVLLATRTMGFNLTGTGMGFLLGHPMYRLSEFGVI